MNELKSHQFEEMLYQQAVKIIDTGRQKIIDSIYNESTKSYYLLGKLILEEEQNGTQRAEYGKNIIKNLSEKLLSKYGKGLQTVL